jgi:uroporphyrinogen decarboxylase
VGFCGGPFTVAGYLVEGRPSREFAITKALMYGEPDVWHGLMEKLSETFVAYALAQARAGADVVQLFDSWVGSLSPADYDEFVAPWSGRVLEALGEAGVPTIHFGTGTATLLERMAAAGGDVIGLDWRIPLDVGWARVGDRAVQGNLDPAVLLGPWERVETAARDVLARAAGRPGHIFNLGHGVLPGTDPGVLGRVRELVHAEAASGAAKASFVVPLG